MTSSNGHHGYDEDLLASAPAPTKGMVQSGYATDLLVEPKPPRRGDIESNRQHRSHSSRHAPNGARATADVKGASTTSIPTEVSKRPFYRTRRGLIIIIIVAIILLAAIIGGAVGGTAKNRSPASQLVTAASQTHSKTMGSGAADPQAGVPDGSSSQGGAVVTVRLTTTLDTALPRITPTPSSTLLGGINITVN